MPTNKVFGVLPSGETVYLYEIKNANGLLVEVMSFGAGLHKIFTPDKSGNYSDIILGYDKLEDYINCDDYSGMVVGPVTNRINGSFKIDGNEYSIIANLENGVTLHSNGDFSFSNWKLENQTDNSVTLSFFSPDGKEGFPGNITATVTYILNDENELVISYKAVSDKKTYLNLTNHVYFNLKGCGNGTILDHQIKIDADYYIPTNETSIPLGKKQAVDGTPFDLREFKAIGDEIDNYNNEQIKFGNGYDHSICLNNFDGSIREVAVIKEDSSGRVLTCYTDLPGLQLYTGNWLCDLMGKYNNKNERRSGFCLETQYHPDAIHNSAFEQCVFEAGEEYKATTKFKFSVE